MNQIVPADQTSTREIGIAVGTSGASIAPQNLGEVVRFAEVMCRADIALPKHLRGNAGACMAVALQALEWQMSPFAVASKSYAVNGAIAYEAQLIAAVVNTRSGIKGRLKYHFSGEGDKLVCRVVGALDGEDCEYVSPPVGAIQPKNSPLWKTDPQQQLGYFSARSWARRHCPEVLLGVYDRDEVEQFRDSENAKDVTPLSERLKLAKTEQHETAGETEGIDKSFVTAETEAVADAGTAPQGEAEAGDIGADHVDTALSASEYTKEDCVRAFIRTATDMELAEDDRLEILDQAKDFWREAMPANADFVGACFNTARKVSKGEIGATAATKYLEALAA